MDELDEDTIFTLRAKSNNHIEVIDAQNSIKKRYNYAYVHCAVMCTVLILFQMR